MEKPTIKSNVTLEGVHTHTHTHTQVVNKRKYKDTCTLYIFWYTKVCIKCMCLFTDAVKAMLVTASVYNLL